MEFDNNKYRKLFAKMPDAFAYHQVIYDQEGNLVDYQFLEINDAFEQLTGLKREAVIGKKVTEVHPEIGYRTAASSPELVGIADLILRHHENFDGSGYPLGIDGEEIPIECRILAIAIAYSAMINPRPYAKKLKPDEALAELKRCAGTQFDPRLVKEFVALIASDPK